MPFPPPYNPSKIEVCTDERRLLYVCRRLLGLSRLQDEMRDLCERVLSGEAPQTYKIVLVIDNEYCSVIQQRSRAGVAA